MIITILNQDGFSNNTSLASHLAMLRAHAGRNVLLIYANSLAPSRGDERNWEAVEIKLGAVALTVTDITLESTLQNLAPRYNDFVINAGTFDLPGNRSVLIATNIAIVPIQPCNFNVKTRAKLINRIEAARVANPSLRVLVVIMVAPDVLSIQDIETGRSFVAAIRSATLVNTPIYDRTTAHG